MSNNQTPLRVRDFCIYSICARRYRFLKQEQSDDLKAIQSSDDNPHMKQLRLYRLMLGVKMHEQ